jgi:hypothetical protein
MYRILEGSQGKLLGIEVSGLLTGKDYDKLVPLLEELIEKEGALRLLVDMRGFSGLDVAAFWEELGFSLRHLNDFEKIAVVGNQAWIEWWVKLTSPLIGVRAQYFEAGEMGEAWSWLKT